MALCPVGTGSLSLRTDTLIMSVSKEDWSFYLFIFENSAANNLSQFIFSFMRPACVLKHSCTHILTVRHSLISRRSSNLGIGKPVVDVLSIVNECSSTLGKYWSWKFSISDCSTILSYITLGVVTHPLRNETSLKNERKEEPIRHILHEESVTPLLWYVENENEE
jgi:hypothetical protein